MARLFHYNNAKNKRAMSAIIVTLLLVALSIGLIAIVWSVVNNLIGGKIHSSSACFGVFDKVTLNSKYTCYDSSTKKINISITIGDVNPEGVSVSISSPGPQESFTIKNETTEISGLVNYDGGSAVKLPGKNSGETYVYSWTGSGVPDSIEISPIISGSNCGASDSISPITSCYKLY